MCTRDTICSSLPLQKIGLQVASSPGTLLRMVEDQDHDDGGVQEAKHPEFGARVRARMERLQLDLRALSKRSRLSYEMVRRYAAGVAKPRDDGMARLAEALETTAAELDHGAEGDAAPFVGAPVYEPIIDPEVTVTPYLNPVGAGPGDLQEHDQRQAPRRIPREWLPAGYVGPLLLAWTRGDSLGGEAH